MPRRLRQRSRGIEGATLMEVMVSAVAASAILGALITASVSIQRSITSTNQFVANTTGQSRLMDYIAQDLRRSVRIGTLVGGARAPLRSQQKFPVTSASILTIDVPDYYAANTPDNAFGSPYKTARYLRASLNSDAAYNNKPNPKLNGVIPWTEATVALNHRFVTRFAPPAAGDGTIEVRYFQAARGHGDPTMCYFRAEYPSGASTPSEVREIADSVSAQTAATTLTISGLSDGNGFRIESAYTPRRAMAGVPVGTATARLDVTLRNPRRD